jgi:hypothetical protein
MNDPQARRKRPARRRFAYIVAVVAKVFTWSIYGTMRTRALVLIAGAVFACFPAQFVPAQDTVEKDTPRGGLKKWIDLLPGGEQAKLRAIHAVAMEDPAVRAADEKRKQAEKEFHDILRAAMLKIDPTVQPILDKMPEPKKRHHRW